MLSKVEILEESIETQCIAIENYIRNIVINNSEAGAIKKLQKLNVQDTVVAKIYLDACLIIKKTDKVESVKVRLEKDFCVPNEICEMILPDSDYGGQRSSEDRKIFIKEFEEAYEKPENSISRVKFWKKKSPSIKFDPDVSLYAIYIYCKIILAKWNTEIFFQKGEKYKYEISKIMYKGKKVEFKLRGDTMNSWKTTWEEFSDLNINPVPLYVTEFMDAVYTMGNFIPVPFISEKEGEFNFPRGNRNKDYWDLALFFIYKWYSDREDNNLKCIVGDDKNVNLCKRWLNLFETWNNFVTENFMQPFVRKLGNDQYGAPYELWDHHFTGEVLPKEKRQFEQFFVNARVRILERGELIAQALVKAENKKYQNSKS